MKGTTIAKLAFGFALAFAIGAGAVMLSLSANAAGPGQIQLQRSPAPAFSQAVYEFPGKTRITHVFLKGPGQIELGKPKTEKLDTHYDI